MKYKELMFLINSDLYRYEGKTDKKIFIKNLPNKGFTITFWYRICRFFYVNNHKIPLILTKAILKFYKEKYCIDLSYKTEIGSGLVLRHLFGTAINIYATIGNNVDLCHGAFSVSNRGEKKGCPVIGDNILSPGSMVIGNVKIGNGVIVGGNSVVTKDIPNHAVVVGIPGKIISYAGSTDYIINTDYEKYYERKTSFNDRLRSVCARGDDLSNQHL